ncbi:MAG TPA: glycosyltransferase, partial [Actinomycetota bacterium]|nr:glycosyltransferase [Actinomycetota bacterium]
MRVLHVSQPVEGGVGRWVAALVAHQRALGWDVVIAAPGAGELSARAAAAGAAVRSWEASRSPGASVPGEVRRLRRIVRAAAPDLVHLHSSKAGLAGRLALRGRVPTVFQPHGWSFYAVTGATRRAAVVWERAGARWADRILCVSAGERARGSAARIRARWAVIPNGTDVEAIALPTERARAALRPRLGVGPGPLVVFVGRIDRAKGPDVLLDAWPAVTAAVPEARLMVVGEGPLLPALAARVPAGAGLAGHRDDPEAW